jgi:hypothetical protein
MESAPSISSEHAGAMPNEILLASLRKEPATMKPLNKAKIA